MKKKFIFVFLFICIICAAVFVIRFYFYYHTLDSVVILVPDDVETKKRPEDPGGLVVPNSDSLVYERLKGKNYKEAEVNLLPEPEEPMALIKNDRVQFGFLDSIDKILENIDYSESEDAPEGDGTGGADYVVPDISLSKENRSQESEKDIYIAGSSLNISDAAKEEYKITKNHLTSVDNEGYKIQLSSAYSYNDAQKKWNYISKKHKNILGDANLVVKKIETKNEKIFFLVMAGNYSSLSYAKLLCKKLLYKKQNCIVTK
jgi:hypothetical protein